MSIQSGQTGKNATNIWPIQEKLRRVLQPWHRIDGWWNACFRQYIPSKPARYGIKIFALVDAGTYYTQNMEVYVGRQPDGPRQVDNDPTSIVMHLAENMYWSGHSLTDHWFTSIELAQRLKDVNVGFIGTVQKNWRFLPALFIIKSAFDYKMQTKYGFNDLGTLTSCYRANKKITSLLSTLPKHWRMEITNENNPKLSIILKNNQTKGGMDKVDWLKVNYSLAQTSRQWILTLFFSLLNIAGINAHIIYRKNMNKTTGRREFSKILMRELVYPQARRQAAIVQVDKAIKTGINVVFYVREGIDKPPQPRAKRSHGRCYLDT